MTDIEAKRYFITSLREKKREMDYGDEMGFTGDDPAMMTNPDNNEGNPSENTNPPPSGGVFEDTSGTKIDYSSFDPVPFKKTATLVNYFITNTAQFLNAFSQVAETKLHNLDNRLDEIEQVLALYEAKLDLDDEFFEELPEIPIPEQQ